MSTNQLHRVKQKPTDTKESTKALSVQKNTTEISSEQSQRLIQTMLTMSFGCLAFLRGLFPDEYFLDQRFVPEKINKNNSNNNDKKKNDNNSSIKIKTLIRGKNKEVDLLLDWLEKSVFQTIKLKYLKCLILDIFLDKEKPNELLENYIFKFDYLENDMIQLSIDSDNNKNNNGKLDNSKNSLLNSRKMVQQLMRRFIIITQSLEPLPSKKFLNMRLVFNDNVSVDYQPNLFKDASLKERPKIKIPIITNELEKENEDDLEKLTRVGTLNTNYNKLNINIFSTLDSNLVKGSNGDTNEFNQNEIDMDDETVQYDTIDPLEQILKDEEQFINRMKKEELEDTANITNNDSRYSQIALSTDGYNINNKFVSQTTNSLGGYLNSQTNVLPTQAVNTHENFTNHEKKNNLNNDSIQNPISFSQDIVLDTQDKILMNSQLSASPISRNNLLSCECNCIVNTANKSQITVCKECGRLLHKLCYGNAKGKVTCFNCLLNFNEDTKKILDSETWKILCTIRKCYRQILRLRGVFPNPINKFYTALFAEKEQTESNLKLFTTALSLLFHDETLALTEECNNTNRKIFIDLPNIITIENIELSINHYHYIKFNKKARNAHSCYLNDVPLNKEQIDLWLKEIDSMMKNLTNSLPSSVNLESLAINDQENVTDNTTINNFEENDKNYVYNDTDTQMVSFGQKRKNLDLDDYLKMDDSSIVCESLDKSKIDNPVKIRKISVSKKTLLSNW